MGNREPCTCPTFFCEHYGRHLQWIPVYRLRTLLIWGFWLSSWAWARGASVALSGWTKFAPLVVAPLWLTYPGPVRRPFRRRP